MLLQPPQTSLTPGFVPSWDISKWKTASITNSYVCHCTTGRVPPIPNFTDTPNSNTGICVLGRHQYRYHVHHVTDIHLNSGSGVIKCIQLSTLQHLGNCQRLLTTYTCSYSSVLACACSFPICWRAIYCSSRCFVNRRLHRLLVLQFFHILKRFHHNTCNKLRQQQSQRNVAKSHSSLTWPSVAREKQTCWTHLIWQFNLYMYCSTVSALNLHHSNSAPKLNIPKR